MPTAGFYACRSKNDARLRMISAEKKLWQSPEKRLIVSIAIETIAAEWTKRYPLDSLAVA